MKLSILNKDSEAARKRKRKLRFLGLQKRKELMKNEGNFGDNQSRKL